MERYGNDESGVIGYELTENGIILCFRSNGCYLYDDTKPGKKHISKMERLAKAGKGLNTYVSQNVRENYRKKLEEETFIKPNPVMVNKLSISKILCEAIRDQRLIEFYYESKKSGKKEWRTVEPYIVGIYDKGKGNAFLAGLPISEIAKEINARVIGQYLLSKIAREQLKVLEETYTEPKVPRKRIVNTPTIKVICRYYYKDETGPQKLI